MVEVSAFRLVALLGASALAITWSAAGAAQTPAPQKQEQPVTQGAAPPADQIVGTEASQQPSDQPADQGGLQDIIVTARKQAENLQNIPVAETVISGHQLSNLGVTSIERMSSLAPQLVIGRSGAGNGASIGLRGVSVANSSVSIEQSVATIVDGVYYSGGRALNEGLFDLAQAEVLKGPQSLFYGKNTTAGAISLTTANPTKEFSASVRTSYEFNAQQPTVEGYVSIPLTPDLGIRFAGRLSKQYDGLFENLSVGRTEITRDTATGTNNAYPRSGRAKIMPGEEQKIGRVTLAWDNGSAFTATGKVTYNTFNTNSPNANVVIYSCPPTGVPSDPAAPCGRNFRLVQNPIAPGMARGNTLFNKYGGDPYLDYESVTAVANLQYTGDKFSLSVIPGYIWWKNQFSGDFDHVNTYPLTPSALGARTGSYTAERSSTSAFSLESRLQTDLDGPLNFMVGGYYQHSDLDFYQDTNAPTGFENSAATDPSLRFVSVRKLSYTKGETLSTFGQVLFDITSTLNLTGGVRYTHETKDSLFRQPYVTPGARATYVETQIGADQTFKNWSPEATLTWKPTADVTLYSSYRTGYKSGGYSISGLITRNTRPTDPAFAPETVRGFEGGVKTTLADRQLRLNLDLFNYNYRNQQVDYLDATLIQFFTLNAARLRTRGGELQAEFAPRGVPDLRLRGSLGYIDARYTSFPFAPCLSAQTVAQGCVLSATPTGTRFNQDLTGERPQQAPKWTGSLGIDYEADMGSDYSLRFSGNGRYSSAYSTNPFVNSFQAPAFNQTAFATVDASFRLVAPDNRWEIGVIGKNLTNHFIVTTASNVPFTTASVRGGVLDPRTVAIEGVIRF